ncbi:cuticle protein AM1199-like [Penaeus indicus]|uniref:cuticle protein AM1199-like n=1 Tax=Penaeus indicus TaxID=29960 RepID=UPI00300C5E08
MIITMNTFAALVCLAAVAAASPQFRASTRQTFQDERQVAILRDDRQDSGDGNFNYNFEAENGISVSGSGAPGSEGQSNMQGSYRFTLPDGTIAEVRYVADEFGFRAESPLIPTPHPLPAHAIEQIRVAEEQRRRGITF